MSQDKLTGVELLRFAVKYLSYNTESVNQRFSAIELLNIAECARAAEWDMYPDQWTEKQLREAAKHRMVPDWSDESTPTMSKSRLEK